MNGDNFTPTRRISYNELRAELQPGDAVFYGPIPLRAIQSLADVGGYISNQVIRAWQFAGADHRRLNNYIHGEMLLPMTIADQTRWLVAGFTNKRNKAGGGLDLNAASWRMENYQGEVLYKPVREQYRTGLTTAKILELIDSTFNVRYGFVNLIRAESRLNVGGITPDPYCTSWMARLYITCHVIHHREFCWTKEGPGTRNLSDANVSPKDLLHSFSHIWDDDRSAVVTGE